MSGGLFLLLLILGQPECGIRVVKVLLLLILLVLLEQSHDLKKPGL